MDGEMTGWKCGVTESKIIVHKFVLFKGLLEEWMENVIMNVRIDWLKDGMMKIKLTNVGVGKYVQEWMYDIWWCWGRNGEMEETRKKEEKKRWKKVVRKESSWEYEGKEIREDSSNVGMNERKKIYRGKEERKMKWKRMKRGVK